MFGLWAEVLANKLESEPNLLFKVELIDCATPSFVTMTKEYFGSFADVADVVRELYRDDKDAMSHMDLMSAKVLGTRQVHLENYEAPFTNVWGYEYLLTSDDVMCVMVWLECNGKYYRCLLAKFYNLRYQRRCETIGALPVAAIWGPKHIIETAPPVTHNRLYEIDKVFTSEAEAKQDMEAPIHIPDFSEFFKDIFADG